MRMLIFGTGRVGGSLARYARHLGAEVDAVGRGADANSVRALIDRADLIAAAIPDDRLSPWFAEWKGAIGARRAIHFSGALTVEGMQGYHPLYSFPKAPLEPAVMAGVAIAREAGGPRFASILPGATNPELELAAEDRAFYHALAVLSGNFAAHLWNETAKAFEDRFNLPPETIMGSYLAGVVDRFRESPFDSMTGPLARRDAASVAANLAALDTAPNLKALYEAFLESAWPEK